MILFLIPIEFFLIMIIQKVIKTDLFLRVWPIIIFQYLFINNFEVINDEYYLLKALFSVVVGYFISRELLRGTCYLLKIRNDFNCLARPKWNIFFRVFLEEYLWRECLLMSLWKVINLLISNFIICSVFAVSISSIFFVLAHPIEEKMGRQLGEMVIYSVCLGIGRIISPGINVGLHFGRNSILLSKAEVSIQ